MITVYSVLLTASTVLRFDSAVSSQVICIGRGTHMPSRHGTVVLPSTQYSRGGRKAAERGQNGGVWGLGGWIGRTNVFFGSAAAV